MRVIILFFLSTSALAADQWLCVGEATATLVEQKNGPYRAEAFEDSQKFLVTAEGVKRIGQDDYWMQPCEADEKGNIDCINGMRDFGYFTKFASNTFLMHYVNEVESGVYRYIYTAGRCSKL